MAAPKKGRPARAHAENCSDSTEGREKTLWKRYLNRFRAFMYAELASAVKKVAEAEGRELSDEQLCEALKDARTKSEGSKAERVSLFLTLKSMSTAIGMAWQTFDSGFWASQGLEAEDFGNKHMYDGADGFVAGDRLQYKISRISVRKRCSDPVTGAVFGVDDLAPKRSGVKNVILFVDRRLPVKDWRLFYGTTEELFETAMQVRERPGRVSSGKPLPLTSGTWTPKVHLVRSMWGGSPCEMTLSSYVAMRFSQLED